MCIRDSITDVTINADNELVLSFSNGNVINLGNIKGSRATREIKATADLTEKTAWAYRMSM